MNIKLKKAREKTGLTQVQVADKAKISVRAYQTYESGKRIPNATTAIIIAQTVNSTVEELFSTQTVTQKQRASQATRCSGETGDETKGGEVYGQSK